MCKSAVCPNTFTYIYMHKEWPIHTKRIDPMGQLARYSYMCLIFTVCYTSELLQMYSYYTLYDWTRKKHIFHMNKNASEEIENRSLKPPILHLPDNRGNFNCSQTLVRQYLDEHCSIFKMLGLCVNIRRIKHLLAKGDFDRTTGHLAFTYMMKSKTTPLVQELKYY